MKIKLYKVKTKTGHSLFESVTLPFLEEKLELQLNDVVNLEMLNVGQELGRKLRIKVDMDTYNNLYSKDKQGNYLVTVQRDS